MAYKYLTSYKKVPAPADLRKFVAESSRGDWIVYCAGELRCNTPVGREAHAMKEEGKIMLIQKRVEKAGPISHTGAFDYIAVVL